MIKDLWPVPSFPRSHRFLIKTHLFLFQSYNRFDILISLQIYKKIKPATTAGLQFEQSAVVFICPSVYFSLFSSANLSAVSAGHSDRQDNSVSFGRSGSFGTKFA
jgi:hypothetical protein